MKFFLKFLLVFLCFSCSQKPAKVVNRSKVLYSKNSSLNKEKYQNQNVLREGSLNKTETKTEVSAEKKLQNRQITVSSGDTLYSISKKYDVTLRDLIKQNNLTPPYGLKNGTVMTIPAQNYHEVKTGETLYGISRLYGMKIDNLIEINDLKEPYSVKVGEKIRISKIDENNIQTAQVAETKPRVVEKLEERKKEKKEEKKEVGFVDQTLDKISHFSWPVRGQVISKFGPKSGGLYNDGINIKAKEGEAVKASENGVVAYVGNELKGYGNLVIIKHSGGWITAYAHLGKFAVTRGQKVEKGAKIGVVGSTGNVNSPQLYFGLRKGRDAVNPQNYLRS